MLTFGNDLDNIGSFSHIVFVHSLENNLINLCTTVYINIYDVF
jgi:hypothetical protein